MHKTAALLKVSVSAGAILAGANDEDILACEKYAEKIGLAFQSKQRVKVFSIVVPDHTSSMLIVADDILDVTATSAELGKTAGKDVDANKTTYVKLLGLEGSKKEAIRVIEEAKAALDRYGDRAIPLKALADYIVARKN
jgi:geranylgeranyl diphosphate synthase, type II